MEIQSILYFSCSIKRETEAAKVAALLLELAGANSQPLVDSLNSYYSNEPGSCGNSLRLAFNSRDTSRLSYGSNFSFPVFTLCPSKPNPVPRNVNGHLDVYTINFSPATRSVVVELLSDSLYLNYLRPAGTLLDALLFRIEFILSPIILKPQNEPACANPFRYPLDDPLFSSRIRQIALRESISGAYRNRNISALFAAVYERKSLVELATCGSLFGSSTSRSGLLSRSQCVPTVARCNHIIDCFGHEDESSACAPTTRAFA